MESGISVYGSCVDTRCGRGLICITAVLQFYGELVCTHAHACLIVQNVRGMWYTAGDKGKGMDFKETHLSKLCACVLTS